MIAETLFLLLGHKSSLFPTDQHIDPAFVPLLHPGERQCLESLGLIAWRYRQIKASTTILSQSNSRYMAALCARLNRILADEYETLVVSTEAKILQRDSSLVGSGSFVPLSSLRATFAEWDAPFAALLTLTEELSSTPDWKPGPLIDLLLRRSRSGVQKVSRILMELSQSVQQVWMTKLAAFLLHSSASVTSDSFADATYKLRDGSVPSVVSAQSRDSIAYIGKALGTAKDAEGQRQMPRPLVAGYVKLLESVLPERQHEFDRVIAEIRASVGEWLWLNVLTKADVDAAVDSLYVSASICQRMH
jgi:gamma-tubulin complex component 4